MYSDGAAWPNDADTTQRRSFHAHITPILHISPPFHLHFTPFSPPFHPHFTPISRELTCISRVHLGPPPCPFAFQQVTGSSQSGAGDVGNALPPAVFRSGSDVDTQIKLAAIQMAVTDDVDANLRTVLRLLDRAASERPQLVVLPELCNHLS